jgi:hypothetical protein
MLLCTSRLTHQHRLQQLLDRQVVRRPPQFTGYKMPVAGGAASLFTPRKVATYGLLSTLAAMAVIVGAFRQRSNFYSAAVMLGRSNGCMMVLFNFGLFLTLCFGKVCQKVFFGPLRAVEVEVSRGSVAQILCLPPLIACLSSTSTKSPGTLLPRPCLP